MCPIKNLGYGSSKRPIEAILIFKDPADWYLDLQIMTDVIMGGKAQSSRQRWGIYEAGYKSALQPQHTDRHMAVTPGVFMSDMISMWGGSDWHCCSWSDGAAIMLSSGFWRCH